ncbi:phenylalanyl-tRNA synthetase alpha chain [Nematocida sp. AWRm80]|nr:phenylalanyl-tRNA synthetase alpha chain [Nematocida sp. AWRm80]
MSTGQSMETEILERIREEKRVCTTEIKGEYNVVIGTVKKLEAQNKVLLQPTQIERLVLTEEGQSIRQNGSPEYILYSLLEKELSAEEVFEIYKTNNPNKTENELKTMINTARSNGLKNKLIKIDNGKLSRNTSINTDTTRNILQNLDELEDKNKIVDLKKRKLLIQKKIVHYFIEQGPEFNSTEKKISDITIEMISSLEIKKNNLKEYNFSIVSNPSKYSGAQHPLSLEREKVKRIFLQMGFKEMDAGKYIESSFWNFDALFQPQRHPSRNEQDTFFLEHPKEAKDPEPEYLERVRQVHTTGAHGSIGYQAPWSLEESRKNVLRTHTTAVTTRLLYQLAKNKDYTSGKYFSIDRVFRNESLDATHLAEFHQVEGIVIGKGLTISHLMGFLEEFFKRYGLNKLRFKPAYNPYTEPSVEVFAYHEEMQKWMEIGNSGMFRPEMLLPMGFDKDIRVIGWGLSLERPVMINRQLNNIRELVGHKVDLSFIREGLSYTQ